MHTNRFVHGASTSTSTSTLSSTSTSTSSTLSSSCSKRSAWSSPLRTQQQPFALLPVVLLRGGAIVGSSTGIHRPDSIQIIQNTASKNDNNNNNLKPAVSKSIIQPILWTILGASVTAFLYSFRHVLFDKQFLQQHTLVLLQRANQHPLGLFYYIIGMALWEMIGLSTIPIETAAGMAFKCPRAILASTLGKLLGAALAFGVGRHVIPPALLQSRLESNEHFQLIQASVAHKPWTTAILLKYSCFPEFVKNYGAAFLRPISISAFLVATVIHGGPFTCVWSWLGHDAALRLDAATTALLLPPNRALQTTMVLAMTVGLVLSPLAMTMWVRDLRKEYYATTAATTTTTKRGKRTATTTTGRKTKG